MKRRRNSKGKASKKGSAPLSVIVFGSSLALVVLLWGILHAQFGRESTQPKSTTPRNGARTSMFHRGVAKTRPPQVLHPVTAMNADPVNIDSRTRAAVEDFVNAAVVSLTEKERELLRTHGPEELDNELRLAEQAFLRADDYEREAAQDRYKMLVGLAVKLAEPPVPAPTQADIERADEYIRQRGMLESELSHLSNEEKRSRIAEFKDTFFEVPAQQQKEGTDE